MGMISDPAERLFSHIQMEGRKTAGLSGEALEIYVNRNLQAVVRYLKLIKSTSEGIYTTVSCQNPAKLWTVYLQLGNYASIISDFNKVLEQNVYVVDGEQILSNPNNEFGHLLDFFELDKSLIDFKYNEDRGFFCMHR